MASGSDRGSASASLYERLGVAQDADLAAVRDAYRRLARQLHPDLAGGRTDGAAMALVNEAWRVLSDPARRLAYDATLPRAATARAASSRSSPPRPAPGGAWSRGPLRRTTVPPRAPTPPPRPSSPGWRREAWLAGLQLQIRRLGTQAARSAAQTLVVRHTGAPRSDYEELIEPIVADLLLDTGDRVRQAREAGAAPFDLANGAALIGLRSIAGRLEAESRTTPARPSQVRTAEMVDRMWDTMAHEIPRPLEHALGDNPKATRRVR